MKIAKFLFLGLAAVLLGTLPAQAADVKVIVNSSVSASSVSGEELKRIFLGTKSSLDDGSHVQPVFEKGGPAHEAFLQNYLGKSDAALMTYYRSLVFTGKGSMPKILATDAEMAEYVAKTKGAIGYVSAGTSTTGVKVLEVK
jgi:ABC-type phosphate transport system substrate-binding protein